MEVLFQHNLTNAEGLQIRATFFKRDARSPRDVSNNEPIRYEHCYNVEVYDEPTETWIIAREEILEQLSFDRQE
jgi:hypothetical protein